MWDSDLTLPHFLQSPWKKTLTLPGRPPGPPSLLCPDFVRPWPRALHSTAQRPSSSHVQNVHWCPGQHLPLLPLGLPGRGACVPSSGVFSPLPRTQTSWHSSLALEVLLHCTVPAKGWTCLLILCYTSPALDVWLFLDLVSLILGVYTLVDSTLWRNAGEGGMRLVPVPPGTASTNYGVLTLNHSPNAISPASQGHLLQASTFSSPLGKCMLWLSTALRDSSSLHCTRLLLL